MQQISASVRLVSQMLPLPLAHVNRFGQLADLLKSGLITIIVIFSHLELSCFLELFIALLH